jgi:hypothetical protein
MTPEGVNTMARKWMVFAAALGVIMSWSPVRAGITGGSPSVDIWTDRGDAGVYRHGEAVEVFVRPECDCYVIVYEIDTDGYLRVLYPYDCMDDGYMTGGTIYRLGRGGQRQYYVTGPSGVEYLHVVASFKPFRQLYWHGCHGYENYAYDVTWRGFSDYWGCALPPRVYGDPFMAMQSIDEFICLDALETGMVWADFAYFYVDERVSFPRYVCYDCHGFHPALRPYHQVCSGFSITFIDCDPCYRPCSWWWWCSPRRVYCGPRYVCNCKKPCGDYPSQYKWKSRTETVRSRDAVISREPVKLKGGDVIDGVRVKAREANAELDLYSRGGRVPVKYKAEGGDDVRVRKATDEEPAGRIKVHERDNESVKVRKIETSEPRTREVESRPVKVDKNGREPVKAPKTEAKQVTVRKTESKKAEQSRIEKAKSSAGSTTKQVAPKVRTQNQGRSPATRRRLSK